MLHALAHILGRRLWTRIFTILAWFALLLMAAVVVLGLMVGDLHQAPTRRYVDLKARVHRLMGVAAAIVVVLVNSIVVTYFIGTSRWCKEVVDTYSLDRELVRRSARLKRRTFPRPCWRCWRSSASAPWGAPPIPARCAPNTPELGDAPHLVAAAWPASRWICFKSKWRTVVR